MTIAVGLSGGVDSAVAALLLKEAGHEVVGVAMRLGEKGCISGQSLADAATIAQTLNIPFEIVDCAAAFEQEVLNYFIAERTAGRTPNPCVVCNQKLKFDLLPRLAAERFAFDQFATGHYLRLVSADGRLKLLRSHYAAKDQSYFLWGLTQDQLARVCFPLGLLAKPEVREAARRAGLAVAESAESQDFLGGETDHLLSLTPREGEFVTTEGKVLAHHAGYWHFTVGQRKGLGFATGMPMYVTAIDAAHNRVVVGTRTEAFRSSFTVAAATVNWVSLPPTTEPITCRVKVRSAGEPVGPVTYHNGTITAPQGVFGVAPGQSAVFYAIDSDELLVGGVIHG